MTRARESLHLITALKSSGAQEPCGYLDHLPADHLEFASYKKSTRQLTSLANKERLVDYLRFLKSKVSVKTG